MSWQKNLTFKVVETPESYICLLLLFNLKNREKNLEYF